MKKFFVVFLMLLLCAGSAYSMSVSTNVPCNVFVDGKPLVFQVKEAQGDVKYELVDYYGKKAAEGKVTPIVGAATIKIAAQKPCYYDLKCTDEKGTVDVSLGVVIDRGDAPLPVEGRIGAVTCSAWLVKNEEYRKPLAKMLRTIGMSWVREPLAWEPTEPEEGKFDWNIYQTVADTLIAEGIYVNQGWTSVPLRTHAGAPGSQYPDDLRHLYRYLKAAAKQFNKHALVWDVLNEIELTWPQLSDNCAAMQKASYLGIKAGNPNARVLQMSFTHLTPQALCDWSRTGFGEGLYESGIGDYFDIYNQHTYLPAWTYPTTIESAQVLLKKFGVKDKVTWITEAGLGFDGNTGPAPHIMKKEFQQMQCRLVPMSATMGLVAGCEKYFWFCMPDYIENGSVQFGMLHPDITPFPSLISMSASLNFIGVSDYIGEYNPNGKKTLSYLFATPKGNVMVAWSDNKTDLTVPTEKAAVNVADMFGATTEVMVKDGAVTVKVGPEAVYLLDIGDKVASKVVKPAVVTKNGLDVKAPKPKMPSKVVMAGRSTLSIDKSINAYKLQAGGIGTAGAAFEYFVDVYNFDEEEGATGTIEAVLPEGWTAENPKVTLKLAPMDRQVVTFKITPVPTFLGINKIVMRGNFSGRPTAPASAFFKYDFNAYAY